MSCIDCTKTKPVLVCVTNLIIGTLANSTAYYIYFKNSSNGKITRVSATSSVAGLLTAVIDFDPLATTYEVWVTLASAVDIEEKETITIEDTEHTCLYIQFQRVYGNTNLSISATNQTLQLA